MRSTAVATVKCIELPAMQSARCGSNAGKGEVPISFAQAGVMDHPKELNLSTCDRNTMSFRKRYFPVLVLYVGMDPLTALHVLENS